MLVLSRKQNQAVRFPSLGISVQVCQITGHKVRLGIDAPRDVNILRDELCDSKWNPEAHEEELHRRRNLLHTTYMAIGLAQQLLEQGRLSDAQETLDAALMTLRELDNEMPVANNSPSSKTSLELATTPRLELRCCESNTNLDPVEPDLELTPAKRQTNTALLVEDNDNERELLAGFLRISGFEVETATNGIEAINYLTSSEVPQAIILDMRMPKLGGEEMISNIRRRDELKDVHVFAVSGVSRSETNVPIGPSGVNRWFQKPIDPARLVQQIKADMDQLAPGYVWPLGVSFAPEQIAAPA